jgi:hypothetical protein
MGLFSLLDGLTDLPIQEALVKVHAAPAITDALTGIAPPGDLYRDVYQMVCCYEAGDWDSLTALAAKLDIKTSQVAEAYAESTRWAQHALPSRRHARQSTAGELRLLWKERAGRERVIPAKLMNASVEGLQLQISEKIPLASYVSCNDPKLGIFGRGCVRYCNYVKGKYVIGVEFRGRTGRSGT